MAHQLGGKVEAGHHREFGRAEIEVTTPSALTDGVWEVGQRYPVWMSHGDRVTKLPKGFVAVGTSANAPIAMIADDKRKFYATQFHLEVVHTPHGAADPAQFRAQDRRLHRRLDDARVQARSDRQNPPPGRQGQGDLRAFRRRRFRRRRGAHPRSDRRAAHLRVRRSRAAAARRSRESRGAVPRPLQYSAGPCRCCGDVSRRRSTASTNRKPSARPSANCSSTCSRPRRRKSAAPSFWRRARSIPT